MRLNNYLNENKDINVNEIKENCSSFFMQSNLPLYRGIRGIIPRESKNIKKIKTIKDRMPVDLNIEIHNLLNRRI